MQAGLVSTCLAWSDIFTTGRVTLRPSKPRVAGSSPAGRANSIAQFTNDLPSVTVSSLHTRPTLESGSCALAHSASTISDAEAAAIFSALTAAVREVVRDPPQLGLIERRFAPLTRHGQDP